MKFFLVASAVPLYAVTGLGLANAKSDIQIIVAVLAFGFVTLAVGLAGVISSLQRPTTP